MHALIVTGGSADTAFISGMLRKEKYELLIAADSGMHFFHKAGILPQIIVGDFDSADPAVLSCFEKQESVEIHRLNPVKDDTDTEYAIRTAIRRGADRISLFGATGSRIDHILGNLTLLGIGLEEGVEIALVDPNNRIRMIDRELVIRRDEQFGRFISLLPFGGEVRGVTLKGMKYPLTDYTMGGFNSLGISNEILEEEGRISIKEGYLLVVESADS